jgi:hypothetical protein
MGFMLNEVSPKQVFLEIQWLRMLNILLNVMVKWVALLLYILEILDSNYGPETSILTGSLIVSFSPSKCQYTQLPVGILPDFLALHS